MKVHNNKFFINIQYETAKTRGCACFEVNEIKFKKFIYCLYIKFILLKKNLNNSVKNIKIIADEIKKSRVKTSASI